MKCICSLFIIILTKYLSIIILNIIIFTLYYIIIPGWGLIFINTTLYWDKQTDISNNTKHSAFDWDQKAAAFPPTKQTVCLNSASVGYIIQILTA